MDGKMIFISLLREGSNKLNRTINIENEIVCYNVNLMKS